MNMLLQTTQLLHAALFVMPSVYTLAPSANKGQDLKGMDWLDAEERWWKGTHRGRQLRAQELVVTDD